MCVVRFKPVQFFLGEGGGHQVQDGIAGRAGLAVWADRIKDRGKGQETAIS